MTRLPNDGYVLHVQMRSFFITSRGADILEIRIQQIVKKSIKEVKSVPSALSDLPDIKKCLCKKKQL